MIVPKKLLLATIAAATSVANGAELTGYLYDVLCVDLSAKSDGGPPDGSDAFLRPQDHTGECLLLDVCVQSGFSLMSADTDADGRHRVVADFTDDASQAAVVDYIKVSDMRIRCLAFIFHNHISYILHGDAPNRPSVEGRRLIFRWSPWSTAMAMSSSKLTMATSCR